MRVVRAYWNASIAAHRRHSDASVEIAADDVVLGGGLMGTHSNGMSARQLEDQLGVTYKTAWLLAQKLRRSMVDPDCELLQAVVEVDQTEIPFRGSDAFFEPGAAGKLLVAGGIEVIDRSAGGISLHCYIAAPRYPGCIPVGASEDLANLLTNILTRDRVWVR